MKKDSKAHQTILHKTHNNKKDFLERFKATRGNVSLACESANIGRRTYYDWIESDPEFKNKVWELDESFKDYLVGSMWEDVDKGVTTMKIFMAKSILKERGYGENAFMEDNKPPIEL